MKVFIKQFLSVLSAVIVVGLLSACHGFHASTDQAMNPQTLQPIQLPDDLSSSSGSMEDYYPVVDVDEDISTPVSLVPNA